MKQLPTIPFVDLQGQYRSLKVEIDTAIQAVLDHGQYIMGPEVKALEAELATFSGAEHCITVASGTEALLISLMALGVKAGDEVITSPFTFAATAEVIALIGATPVFVDIEPDTCNIDATKIEAKITARTAAIMPVSLYGQCADMDEVNSIAARYGLPVIEDAAQSFGASYQGRRSCSLSTIGCTSFFPSKPLGCYGDGGAIFTSDEALAQACREIRVHGQSARYTHTRVGVGGRMDTLQCAVVLAKFREFSSDIAKRQALGDYYIEQISKRKAPIRPVIVREDRTTVWGQFTVFSAERESLQARLKDAGVPTAIHYPRPLNRQPAYAKFCCPECCPVSEQASSQVLSLPMSPHLTTDMIDRIVTACFG